MKTLGFAVIVAVVIGLVMAGVRGPNQTATASEYSTYSGVEKTTYHIGGDINVTRFYDSELDTYCWKTGANQGGISCLPRGFVEKYKTTGN